MKFIKIILNLLDTFLSVKLLFVLVYHFQKSTIVID